MFDKLILIKIICFNLISARQIHILMTELFEIVVEPSMFNLHYEESKDQYVYQASLLNAPDLPSWMNFVYTKENYSGVLYGVPPNTPNAKVPLEIIALNKKNYETKVEKLNVVILNKRKPARFEVNMKIDNVSVEDMFNVDRRDALKDIFTKEMWKNSRGDLYITFLSSAVEFGARKPLVPDKKEGVVLRLGSYEEFSPELEKLQEEIRPLRKLETCNFKRTSVQKTFTNKNFTLDWCFFRLIYNNNSGLNQLGANEKLSSFEESHFMQDRWSLVSKSNLPERSYSSELLISIVVPLFLMMILTSALSFMLCIHHDDLDDEGSEEFFNNLFHICTDYYYDYYIYRKTPENIPSEETNQFTTIQKATESIRSLSLNRELNMSPDPMLLSRSQTNSPTSTIGRGVHCRPSPPPYVRPKFKPEL